MENEFLWIKKKKTHPYSYVAVAGKTKNNENTKKRRGGKNKRHKKAKKA